MTVSDIAVSRAGAEVRRSLEAASPRYGEKAIKAFLFFCAALSVATTTAIVLSLLLPAISFFQEVPIVDFLTGTRWAPNFADAHFGALPILVGSMMIVGFALAVGIPVGLASAIYLSEYAPQRVRKFVKPALEMLAGIPTVAIGLFGFAFLIPLAQDELPFLPWEGTFSSAVAGVAVGLLIVPLIASVSDDAMRAVPHGLREGAYALGASKLKVSLRVVFPAAISGVVASIVLGMSRAVGETMVVLMMAGAGTRDLTFNPWGSVQTITAYIGSTATGDIATGTIQYDSIFAAGALLFVITFSVNMVAIRLARRFREAYE
jgi:phosphate transport system permease protein